MQDLSDVLARYLDEIEEKNLTVDEACDELGVESHELKSLMRLADELRKAKLNNDITARPALRSRSSLFKKLRK